MLSDPIKDFGAQRFLEGDWWGRVYKRSVAYQISSFSCQCWVMSHEDRVLTERDIVVVLREELERRLKILSDDKIVGSDRKLSHSVFHLDFDVVSPLYYKLQRHLIDWGTRTQHPGLADSKLTKWLDQRGYRYDDIIPLQYRGDVED